MRDLGVGGRDWQIEIGLGRELFPGGAPEANKKCFKISRVYDVKNSFFHLREEDIWYLYSAPENTKYFRRKLQSLISFDQNKRLNTFILFFLIKK